MIATLAQPTPPAADGLVSTMQKGTRLLIPELNSFATIQELQRRERRMSSLLNHGGFFLTSAQSPLRLAHPAMQKLKAGLKRAMRLTDRLADADGRGEIVGQLSPAVCPAQGNLVMSWRMLHKANRGANPPVPESAELRAWLFMAHDKQSAIIKEQSTSDLAWLMTLAKGAVQGFERYTVRTFNHAAARAVANTAFQEFILRDGSSALWAFVRGDKCESAYWESRLAQCGCEIVWWEEGGSHARTASGDKLLPDGLHMTIVRELQRRFIQEAIEERERRREEKAQKEAEEDEDDEEDEVDPSAFGLLDTWVRVNAIIKKEIGAEEWLGYQNVQWPAAFEEVGASTSSGDSALSDLFIHTS